jgi:hypothetical protein
MMRIPMMMSMKIPMTMMKIPMMNTRPPALRIGPARPSRPAACRHDLLVRRHVLVDPGAPLVGWCGGVLIHYVRYRLYLF